MKQAFGAPEKSRRVRRVLSWLALASAGWALLLAATGGFAVEGLGWTLRSRNPTRAAIVTTLLTAAYLAAGGRARTLRHTWARLPDLPRRPAPYLATLAIGFLAATVTFGSRAVGGSDSFGYASMAELLLRGELAIDQPFALEAPWPNAPRSFSPLAYQPRAADPAAIVPIVAPGYPALLAAAKAIGGQDALFLIAPLAGVVLIVATFGLGARLVGPWAGLIAAWLVTTSPIVLSMAMTAMTDVPGAAAWLSAIYFVTRTEATGAAWAGATTALAVLIRPNLAPLAAVLACRYLAPMSGLGWRDRLLRAAIFVATFVPGPIAMALLNQHLFGSPTSSGYGSLGDLFTRSRIGPNLWNYGGWLIEAHTPTIVVGIVAIGAPARWLWPRADRAMVVTLAIFAGVLWAIYSAYDVFGHWSFLRYMTPSVPLFAVGVGAVAAAIGRTGGRVTRALVAVAILLVGAAQLARAVEADVFENWYHERRYLQAALLTRQVTGPRSAVLAAAHSGSVRYYGGRVTMRYHELPSPWLDRAVDWLEGRGVAVYAVLDSWEIPDFRTTFAGAATLASLERPIAVYDTPGHLEVFRLTRQPTAAAAPARATGVPLGWRAVSPAPPPRLRLDRR